MSRPKSGKSRTIQVSVTDFAVPSPRLGSIEQESGFGPLPSVGSEIHLEIQRQRLLEGGTYVAEKWLSYTFEAAPYKITVSGRSDGFRYGMPIAIEEIKTSYNPTELLQRLAHSPHHPYALQLRTYGYIHWLATGQEPDLKLIVVCARTRKATELVVQLDCADYENWLKRRLDEITVTQQEFDRIQQKRAKLGQDMTFPFDQSRPGQRELIACIENEIKSPSRILIQAPTGLGKTIGVLYPLLKEALSRGQKTVYVTAKNSQHAVAEDAVERLHGAGSKIQSVTIHAKSKMCLKDQVLCTPEYCEYAREYYTKLNAHGLKEKLSKKRRLSEDSFKDLGREFEVCPFELQLEAATRADLIICDYNYVFSPRGLAGRLTANGFIPASKPNLAIDEAHNLPGRASEYFSAQLDLGALESLAAEATYLPEPLWRLLKKIRALLDERCAALAAGYGPRPHKLDPSDLDLSALEPMTQELLAAYLKSNLELRKDDPVLKICHQISDFVIASVQSGEEFIFTRLPQNHGDRLRITCCDAAKFLAERYCEFANLVAFSATVKPFDFYLATLGLDPLTSRTAEFHSPFPSGHRKILIIPQISTRFKDRERNYGKVRDTIEKIASLKKGNYFVFFPSFEFLNRVAAITHMPGFRILQQSRDMRRRQVEEFISQLEDPSTPTIIFAVQGGVFAEGVDYPGRMLIGALIVGPALPTFDFERECLREYFEAKGNPGFDFAYTYPAMTRVIQSAGRVIRSAEDRGLIILMDRRFLHDNYLKTMPVDWLHDGSSAMQSKTILHDIEQFWRDNETP